MPKLLVIIQLESSKLEVQETKDTVKLKYAFYHIFENSSVNEQVCAYCKEIQPSSGIGHKRGIVVMEDEVVMLLHYRRNVVSLLQLIEHWQSNSTN